MLQYIDPPIEKIHHMKLTSHRGDSGIKNRPGIKIVQGNIPAKQKRHKIPSIYWFLSYILDFYSITRKLDVGEIGEKESTQNFIHDVAPFTPSS